MELEEIEPKQAAAELAPVNELYRQLLIERLKEARNPWYLNVGLLSGAATCLGLIVGLFALMLQYVALQDARAERDEARSALKAADSKLKKLEYRLMKYEPETKTKMMELGDEP